MRRGLRLYRVSAGFTLLELLLVIAIVGGLTSLGVSTFTQVSNTQIRVATNKLAAAMRHSFGYAVSHGRYVRMVLDLDTERYWVESSDKPIFLSVKKREENVDPNELTEEEREAIDRWVLVRLLGGGANRNRSGRATTPSPTMTLREAQNV